MIETTMDKKRKASDSPSPSAARATHPPEKTSSTEELEYKPHAKEHVLAIPKDVFPMLARLSQTGESFAQLVAFGGEVTEVIQLAQATDVGLVAP